MLKTIKQLLDVSDGRSLSPISWDGSPSFSTRLHRRGMRLSTEWVQRSWMRSGALHDSWQSINNLESTILERYIRIQVMYLQLFHRYMLLIQCSHGLFRSTSSREYTGSSWSLLFSLDLLQFIFVSITCLMLFWVTFTH